MQMDVAVAIQLAGTMVSVGIGCGSVLWRLHSQGQSISRNTAGIEAINVAVHNGLTSRSVAMEQDVKHLRVEMRQMRRQVEIVKGRCDEKYQWCRELDPDRRASSDDVEG